MTNRIRSSRAALLLVLALLLPLALAHETQTVTAGDESYDVIVGFSTEPAYTGERNGLELIVRDGDGEPVANLENSLSATLTAPDGESVLDLQLRAVHGQPGSYTDDFVLTEPGLYTLHLTGFMGSAEVDLTFEMHEVGSFEELRFP